MKGAPAQIGAPFVFQETTLKVYQPGTRGQRSLFAQPGKEFPTTHFLDAAGQPIMFTVTFRDGEASVDDQLAQYLIDKGLATRSPIILPTGVAA